MYHILQLIIGRHGVWAVFVKDAAVIESLIIINTGMINWDELMHRVQLDDFNLGCHIGSYKQKQIVTLHSVQCINKYRKVYIKSYCKTENVKCYQKYY